MVRQFLTLGAGETVGRGLHALAVLLLARHTGPAALGEFGVAQSIASYGMLAVQRGLEIPAMLRATRQPERAGALRAAVVRLRLPVCLVLLAAAAIGGNRLLLAMSGMWLAGALQMRWLLLATRKSSAVAGASVLASLIFLGAAAAGLPLVWVAAALSVGEVCGAAWGWAASWVRWERAEGLPSELQRESWPFVGSLLLGNLLYNLDVFVLGAFRNDAEVGLYLAAYRLITVFSPVLGALQNSSLPVFGTLYPDGVATGRLADRVWRRSAGVALVIGLFLAAGSGALLPLLFGEAFRPAVTLVPWFAAVLPVQVSRMVYRQALLAFRGERRDFGNLAAAVGVNLVLDLALAPGFGAKGCAVSTLCAESCFAILTWRAWKEVSCA